jgi:hypothetical protein
MSTRSRRSFLRALSAVGLASPFAGLFRELWAADATAAPRLCILSSPHGYAPQFWRPRAADKVAPGDERGFTLDFANSSLAPLEKHKDSLVILEGLDLATDFENPDFFTGGHNSLSVLTGHHPAGAESTPTQYKAMGASLDHFVAKLLGTTEFLFTPVGYSGGNNTIGAFREDGTAIDAEYDLKSSLTTWFRSVTTDPTDTSAAAKHAAEVALMEYLTTDATRLRQRLAGTERSKLDAHLDALAGISRRIDQTTSIACSKPTEAPDGNRETPAGNEYIPIVLDFTAQLLACDLTRVVNLSIDPVNSGSAPWLADKDPIFASASLHNDIAHGYRPEDEASQKLLSFVTAWYAEQVSYFIDRLKATPEGNGTVYDNTIILWTTELGDPARHMHTNVPFVLAGGGGSFEKGRYLAYGVGTEIADTSDPHSRLLTSLANQFGANVDHFGDPAYTGELPRL